MRVSTGNEITRQRTAAHIKITAHDSRWYRRAVPRVTMMFANANPRPATIRTTADQRSGDRAMRGAMGCERTSRGSGR